ncbi:helix-turn-helix protein [Amycolatopsis sulphurea]|uniref:Helix-turn-helix protein n=1 Tax=Amycolatopsis sulphurea TaxID=76022 RepID=A0A2A9F9I5_9PSEU|nr:helix-turn-helix domain-containing protein [Amycolatopsis sulphurea]PFG48087.1 helix-turn-helix protein [Amycolatopsis sulphurea]
MVDPRSKGGPLRLPDWAWRRAEVRDALKERDVGALLRSAQKYTGASQSRVAVAVGMLQGRVSEILRGNRTVTTLELFERIAAGLEMPDDARMLLGLAPVHPAGLDHLGASGRAEILAVFPSQSKARIELEQRASEATEVEVLAVRGLGILGMNDSLLRAHVRQGSAAVRVLLLDPDGEAAVRRAAEIGEQPGSFSAGIRLSIELLRDLAAEGAEVEAHTYDVLPTWRVIGLDSTLFISAFGDRHEGHTSPMYKITGSPHGALHRGFRRFMDELRRTSRRVV